MIPAVKTVDLHKVYQHKEIQVEALRGITFTADRGEALAIMGPSGSGKTTLLNIIGALDRPTSGQILLENQDISQMNDNQLTHLRRFQIGFVFQFYNLIPVLSAAENIELPMLIASVQEPEREERVQRLLDMIGLTDRASHRPDELSGGEQQRVAIARALSNQPAIILADEPTGDLDEKTGLEIVDELIKLAKQANVCLLTVTHDPVVGEKMDRILQIRDGCILS